MRSSLALLVVAACGGDSTTGADGAIDHDGGFADAASEPAPPVLGAQLDRAGRPLVRTLLIGAYASAANQATLRAAYDAAADASAWRTTTLPGNVTIEHELAANLAVFDAFDRGQPTANIPTPGCGNGLLYGAPVTAASYLPAADLFADDQIYVDTSKATCNIYLELEVQAASGGTISHLTCGGRSPSHDVVDVTYSVLAAGVAGLTPQLAPRLRDGVSAHGDIKDTFPFLGQPH